MKLLYFVADLMRQPQLQQAFAKDPANTMREHGLSAEEQAAVMKRDVATIARLVGQVMHSPSGRQLSPMMWPGPVIALQTWSPREAVRGQSNIAVEGTGLWIDGVVTCTVEQGSYSLDVRVTQVNPPPPGSRTGESSFTGTLSIPATAPAGTYSATVRSTTSGQSTLDQAMKVS